MSTIDRIFSLLSEKGYQQKDLTDYLGLNKGVSSQWKTGKSRSYNKYLDKIAEFLNTSPSELMDWTPKSADLFAGKKQLLEAADNLARDDALRFVTSNTYNIPVYESVSAGFGAYANDYVIDYTPIFIASPEEAQNTMVVVVSGNSMYPKIEDGDQIQVLRQDWAENGDIAVVLVDSEEAVVKKYYCDREKETVELISINPEYAPRVFKGREIEQIRVLGVVKRIIKDV